MTLKRTLTLRKHQIGAGATQKNKRNRARTKTVQETANPDRKNASDVPSLPSECKSQPRESFTSPRRITLQVCLLQANRNGEIRPEPKRALENQTGGRPPRFSGARKEHECVNNLLERKKRCNTKIDQSKVPSLPWCRRSSPQVSA